MLRLEGVSKRYGRGGWVLQDAYLDDPIHRAITIVSAKHSGKVLLSSIGLLCSRLVIRRQGYALVAALGPVMGALVARDVSPQPSGRRPPRHPPPPGHHCAESQVGC